MSGDIIGYDLNERCCQISFYNESQKEPQTIGTIALEITKNGQVVYDLYQKAIKQEMIALKKDDSDELENYDAVGLLAEFIELSLEKFPVIRQIVFTVPQFNEQIEMILKSIGQRIGVPKRCVYVQDYRESFYSYMLHQPRELYQNEVALFHCEEQQVGAFVLRKVRKGFGKGKDNLVMVDKVAHEQIEELKEIYPVLNMNKAKEADLRFKEFVQGVLAKRLVSSVFLVGDGFENNWYPQSLKVLCSGRRTFVGNNLYSRGACYLAYKKYLMADGTLSLTEEPVYLDETKMKEQICMKMRVNGCDKWQPIVSWGKRWTEADTEFEVLLKNPENMEIHIESLSGNEMRAETISMEGLPQRNNYTVRLLVKVLFLEEMLCKICVRDIGFGDFFPATDFYVEKEIRLGGQ